MIEVRNLTRKYGSFTAVNNVSFEIPKGQIVGLLGHNGAGKTTTLKVMTGYLEPTSGTVRINGLDIEEHRQTVQANIGYLSEQSPLYPEMPVWKYLEYVADLRGIAPENRESAVREAIEATDLQDKASECINTLSKGYRQRVGVAQAIIHKPELLILDEPTNGLDPTQILAMRNLIKRLAQTSTIIISTHIMQEVEAICDRVIIVLNGRIAVDSKLVDLQKNNCISVTLNQDLEPVRKTMLDLPGVKAVHLVSQNKTTNSFQIETTDNSVQQLTPVIAKKALEKGWELHGLNQEFRNLESVFKEVNRGGPTHV